VFSALERRILETNPDLHLHFVDLSFDLLVGREIALGKRPAADRTRVRCFDEKSQLQCHSG
jgi:hypothetical protein